MSSPAEVDLDILVEVADRPDWARAETKRMNAYNREHGAMYGEDPIPVSLKPNFVSPDQERLLARASHLLWGALETFLDVFLESPQLQDLWDVSDEELSLYKVDPGYPDAIQITRFDGFLEGDALTFLEFNCDSPGGAGYGDVIHEAFLEVVHRNPHLGQGKRLGHRSRVDGLRDALLDCWSTWREGRDRPAEPYVVLADWPDVGSRPDIDITVKRLEQAGLDVAFADPRELDLDGDELVHGEDRVDVLYKRVITSELLENEAAEAILEAYRAGTVCMVNAPRSVVVGNKKIMAALQREEIQAAMTPAQRAAVDRFVPWTAILQDGDVEIDGLKVDVRDLALDNKDELVLKPARGYGGEGVHLGPDTDEATWGQLIDEHLDDGDWVLQRMADVPKRLYPLLEDDSIQLSPVNVNVNPFVFGGEYAGAYTRISRENVINVSHGGGLVPTVTVEDDRVSD